MPSPAPLWRRALACLPPPSRNTRSSPPSYGRPAKRPWIAVIPAVVAGIAPHAAAGSYRAAFATAQGAAAAVATFTGPLVARSSVGAFALGCVLLTGAGVTAIAAHARFIEAGLRQPVACPCGALLCSCDADHIACAYPTPIVVHGAAPTPSSAACGSS